MANEQSLVDVLFAALTARFGPLTSHAICKVHTGMEFSRFTNGAVVVTQDGAIARAASLVGVSHLPAVVVPVLADFFKLPTGSILCAPVDSIEYSRLTGKLVQFLKTRHEIRQFVSYLCSYNASLLERHYRQAIHILRYLASTPGVGCVVKFVVLLMRRMGCLRRGAVLVLICSLLVLIMLRSHVVLR